MVIHTRYGIATKATCVGEGFTLTIRTRGMDFNKQDDIVLSGDQRGLFIVHRLSTGEQICRSLYIY